MSDAAQALREARVRQEIDAGPMYGKTMYRQKSVLAKACAGKSMCRQKLGLDPTTERARRARAHPLGNKGLEEAFYAMLLEGGAGFLF